MAEGPTVFLQGLCVSLYVTRGLLNTRLLLFQTDDARRAALFALSGFRLLCTFAAAAANAAAA